MVLFLNIRRCRRSKPIRYEIVASVFGSQCLASERVRLHVQNEIVLRHVWRLLQKPMLRGEVRQIFQVLHAWRCASRRLLNLIW